MPHASVVVGRDVPAIPLFLSLILSRSITHLLNARYPRCFFSVTSVASVAKKRILLFVFIRVNSWQKTKFPCRVGLCPTRR